MKKNLLVAAIFSACLLSAQNDLDMLRYTRSDVGGTARFVAMGGAFGAVGADITAANYNPAGLAMYRKSDLNFGFGIKFDNTTTNLNRSKIASSNSNLVFSNFGLVASWKTADPDNRQSLGFTNVQSQNFNNRVVMSGRTIGGSITRDFLNLAQGQTLNNLSNSYEGLAYDTYLLDYDSVQQRYFTFLDPGRSVMQTRTLEKTGRVNDLNISYAYTHKDQIYLGLSLGFPQVNFSSTMTHEELDDKDSMRVGMTGPSTFTTSYTSELPFVFNSRLGFHSLSYQEFFKTTGSGLNLKIGGIYRVNDQFRIGGYYHTPTMLTLTDQYVTTMSVAFDKNRTAPETLSYPEDGGIFKYRIRTPSRIALNMAYVIGKDAVLAIDYEKVNYSKGSLSSSSSSGAFSNVNSTIEKVYQSGHNLRCGIEYNLNPIKVRAGYVMNGSPYGKVFSGEMVRNTVSFGAGFVGALGFYLDLCLALTFTEEQYYLYNTMDTHSRLISNRSLFSGTVGFKF